MNPSRPESKRNRDTQFAPRWRHFHPQDVLFVRNPFNHDVVFQVADEHNIPYSYRMRAGKVCELPGGAVATLGLKALVDQLINDRGVDLNNMFDLRTRERYEADIIVKVREAPQTKAAAGGGEIDLEADEEDLNGPDNRPEAEQMDTAGSTTGEQEFPGRNRQTPASKSQQRRMAAMEEARASGKDAGVAATAAASLGSKNQVIEED